MKPDIFGNVWALKTVKRIPSTGFQHRGARLPCTTVSEAKPNISWKELVFNAYVWDLEKWNRRSCFQGGKVDTDIKNRLRVTVQEGEGGMTWENSIETYILSYVKQIVGPGSMHGTGCSGTGMTQRDGMGRKVGGGFWIGNTCTPMSDSCQCMAETTTIL